MNSTFSKREQLSDKPKGGRTVRPVATFLLSCLMVLLSFSAVYALNPVSSALVPGVINTLSDDNGENLVNNVGDMSASPLTGIASYTVDIGDYIVGVVGITSYPTSSVDPTTVNQFTAVYAIKVSGIPGVQLPDLICFPRITGMGGGTTGACRSFVFAPTGDFNGAVNAAFPNLFTSLGIAGFTDIGGGALPADTVALMFEGPPNDFLRSTPGDTDGNGTPNEINDAAFAAANGTLRMVVGAVAGSSDFWQSSYGPVWIGDAAKEASLSVTKVSQVGAFTAKLTILSQNFPDLILGPAITLTNGAFSGDVSSATDVPWNITSNVDLQFAVSLPCKVDITKQVREIKDPPGDWANADQCTDSDVPVILVPGGAEYQLIVENTGKSGLSECVITDDDLLFSYSLGTLAPGEIKVLSGLQIPQLYAPDRCSQAGVLPNTAEITCQCTETIGATAQDEDSACVICGEEIGACRMTGGNVTVTPCLFDGVQTVCYDYVDGSFVLYGTVGQQKKQNPWWITTGGQIGAPSIDGTPKNGHWTHTQHGGAEGNFTFLSGTSSAPNPPKAPPGTEITTIECADKGWCVQARCAPFKQIFWTGIGYFPEKHGNDLFAATFPFKYEILGDGTGNDDGKCDAGESCGDCVITDGSTHVGSQHWYHAMVGDFGDNDKPTRRDALQDANPDSCNWYNKLPGGGPPGPWTAAEAVSIDSEVDEQFGDKGGQVCDKCLDYYQIQIYCKATNPSVDPTNFPIYLFYGYLNGGNYQIHPETGDQCPVDPLLFPELFGTGKVRGGGKK